MMPSPRSGSHPVEAHVNAIFHPNEQCASTQPFVECHGVDLHGGLTPRLIEDIRAALVAHGLVLFRDQHNLTPADEVAFNEAFGWHDETQSSYLFGGGAPNSVTTVSGGAQMPQWPQVQVLGNARLDDYWGIRNTQLVPTLGLSYSGWHCDGVHDMFDGLPELTTMSCPTGWQTERGGDTYFTSGVRAIDRMPAELAATLSECVVASHRHSQLAWRLATRANLRQRSTGSHSADRLLARQGGSVRP